MRKFAHPKSHGNLCFHCDPELYKTIKKKEAHFVAGLLSMGAVEVDRSDDIMSVHGASVKFRRELPIEFWSCNLGVERQACDEDISQRCRVDFVFESPQAVVLLELDEHQHADRCLLSEVARANEAANSLFMGGNHRPLLILRFNPDRFTVDGVLKSVPLKQRYHEVWSKISGWLFNPSCAQDTYIMMYVYFNMQNGVPAVTLHTDFNTRVKERVVIASLGA